MPTMTVLADGTIPVAEDLNGNWRRLNEAIGTGTAITTYAIGDLPYGSAVDTLARLAIGTAGQVLTVSGGLPVWSSAGTSTGTWAHRNLTGTVTATTIAVSAYSVALRNATFGIKVHENTGTITLDSANSGLNGRDQAGAFSSGQTLHAYWISDGTNLRTVLADSAPVTGPDLATLGAFAGYTYWAYIGPFIWNGSSNFIPGHIRSTWMYYSSRQSALTDGRALAETAISLSASVPATALLVKLHIEGLRQTNGAKFTLRIVSGSDFDVLYSPLGSGLAVYGFFQIEIPNVSQQLYYLYNSDPGANAGLHVDVQGYKLPNGSD